VLDIQKWRDDELPRASFCKLPKGLHYAAPKGHPQSVTDRLMSYSAVRRERSCPVSNARDLGITLLKAVNCRLLRELPTHGKG
jgi:hypothetical protein